MKFGVCGYLTAKNADGTEFDMIPAAIAAGYDYIEMPLSTIAALSEADFADLKAKTAAGGLPVEALNVFFPRSLRLTGPDVDWKQVEAYLEMSLGRAAQLGVKSVVFGSGGSRNVPEGFAMEEAWQQLVHLLRLAEPVAAKNDITIVIEPLNDKETNIIHTGSEGFALAKLVNRPHIKLLLDLFHMSLMHEDCGIAVTARDYVRHAHFARPVGRAYPGEMDDEFLAFFGGLKRAGYDGRVSIEAGFTNFAVDAPRALAIMKQALAQA
jgi:D-psicose/D-tagatose/L-ribulose 3-epimerase